MVFFSSPYGFVGKEKVLQEASTGAGSSWAIPGKDVILCVELLGYSTLLISVLFCPCNLDIHCWLSLSNAVKFSLKLSTPSLACSFPSWNSGCVIFSSVGSDFTCTGVGRLSSFLWRPSSAFIWLSSSGRWVSGHGFTSGICFCSPTWTSPGLGWIPV